MQLPLQTLLTSACLFLSMGMFQEKPCLSPALFQDINLQCHLRSDNLLFLGQPAVSCGHAWQKLEALAANSKLQIKKTAKMASSYAWLTGQYLIIFGLIDS